MPSAEESSFETLARGECLRLLATQSVGRVGVSTGMHALVFPVNYVLDGEAIVFRTDAGAKLDHAPGQPVAFEVDHIDVQHHSGWSVHIWGKASEIGPYDSREMQARVYALPLVPWVAGEKKHWIRITPVEITGRRLTGDGPSPAP